MWIDTTGSFDDPTVTCKILDICPLARVNFLTLSVSLSLSLITLSVFIFQQLLHYFQTQFLVQSERERHTRTHAQTHRGVLQSSMKGEGKMVLNSRMKWVGLVGLVLSAFSLFIHFLLARFSAEAIVDYQSSITLFSWRPIFESPLFPITVMC